MRFLNSGFFIEVITLLDSITDSLHVMISIFIVVEIFKFETDSLVLAKLWSFSHCLYNRLPGAGETRSFSHCSYNRLPDACNTLKFFSLPFQLTPWCL